MDKLAALETASELIASACISLKAVGELSLGSSCIELLIDIRDERARELRRLALIGKDVH